MEKIKYLLFAICYLLLVENANAFSTTARSAFLIDYDSGAVLYEKNADTLMPPSSMLKLMTLAVVFDAVKSGELEMDARLTVGENADYRDARWYPASKLCLTAGQTISVRDAIMGLIVQSAGDAAVVVAERLAGGESEFTTMMQKKARAIGMPESVFGNASGLPDPNNLMTSRELATLATHIISDYPDMYPMFATRRFEFAGHTDDWCREWGRTHTNNYNRLLFNMAGADGLKTGHTADGGYGMVGSSKIGGRRLVGVINGLNVKNHDALANEMKKLLNHGYDSTSNKVFYQPGDDVVEIPVWYGRADTVTATVARPFAVTLTADQHLRELRVVARYEEPIPAPIASGGQVGELIAYLRGDVVARAPLVAKSRVSKIQFLARVWKNITVIFNGR